LEDYGDGSALWARKVARCSVHVGDVLPQGAPVNVRCGYAAEHLGALGLALALEWGEP
jgi:hypothetical protein